MTNDIEAAARAAARHALEAVGVRPNNADDFDEIVDNAARSAIAHAARGEGEVDRLARFIMENIPGEPSKSEGAVDCAIRLLSRPTPPPATGEAGSVTPADLARSLDAVAAMIDGATSLDNVARIQRERDEAQKVLTDMLAYVEREHGTDADEGMCDEDDPCDMAVLIKRAHVALGTAARALPEAREGT